MTATTVSHLRLPFSSSINRHRDMLSQQEDKPKHKHVNKMIPTRAAPLLSQQHSYSTCVVNRDGSDTEESGREVYRTQRVWMDEEDELNNLRTLKRANPVFDCEDDDEDPHFYESPT